MLGLKPTAPWRMAELTLFNSASPARIKRAQDLLAPDDPAPFTFMNNLALLYEFQGRYREAEPLYRLTLEKRRAVLGEDHPDTLGSVNHGKFVLARKCLISRKANVQVLVSSQ